MTKKSRACYEAVFDFINLKICDLTGTKMFVTDYEAAMRGSLRNSFPSAKLSACFFHFAQAVRKNAKETKGLMDFLNSNKKKIKSLYYKLMYLPHLPPQHVNSIFIDLKKEIESLKSEEFNKFITYYEKQWMVTEGARRISVFENELRSTSPAEGYNRALNDYCQKKGSFVWFCVSIRNQEFMKCKEFDKFIESGGLVGDKRKNSDKVSFK